MTAPETSVLTAGIWFSRLATETGLGMARARRLAVRFGSIQQLFCAHEETVAAALPLPPQQVLRVRYFLRDDARRRDAERAAAGCAARGVGCVTDQDCAYPSRLREISNHPFLLFYRGHIQAVLGPTVPVATVIGTRSATPYGEEITRQITREIARAGVSVVSGLARGIDSIAHRAALEAGGLTAAVLGGGIDHAYPPEHRALMEEIAAKGVILSEHGPSVRPARSFFASRNRILSGLADAVVITEAADKSGSMITAGFAADQGKDLFAVPGSIFEPHSRGCNRLIREGAYVCLEAEDLLYRLPFRGERRQVDDATSGTNGSPFDTRIRDCLRGRSLTAGEISAAARIPMETLLPLLSALEWRGDLDNRRGRFSLTPAQI